MTAAMAMPGNTAATFLVHFFGTGLADDRYVVERFKARADGDIVPAPAEALAAKGRREIKRKVVSRKEVEAMRPDRTEIIICTGLKTRGGRQAWGSVASGLLCDRKQKGCGCSPTAGPTCIAAASTPARPCRLISGASASST